MLPRHISAVSLAWLVVGAPVAAESAFGPANVDVAAVRRVPGDTAFGARRAFDVECFCHVGRVVFVSRRPQAFWAQLLVMTPPRGWRWEVRRLDRIGLLVFGALATLGS